MNMERKVVIGFRPQPGPQVAFLRAPFDIVVYGGARGGKLPLLLR